MNICVRSSFATVNTQLMLHMLAIAIDNSVAPITL